MASKAKKIFAEYIAIQSCKEVSESENNSHGDWKKWHQNSLLQKKIKKKNKREKEKKENMHFPFCVSSK